MKRYLTEAAIRSLKSEKTMRVWDTHTNGFGISIGSRAKSWIVRIGEKRTVRKLGRYPGMSLVEARRKAMAVLSAEPEQVATTTTVAEAFDEYERTYCAEHHGPRTQQETQRLYRRYAAPVIGHKKLSSLTFATLESLLPPKPSEANHVFRALRAFLSWCVRKEYLSNNPLMGKRQPAKERARDRVLSNEEIVRLWNSAEGQYGTIWKLLLLTGQRRSQIVGLEWEWVKDDRIEFPASVMKSAKPHIIPIERMSQQILPAREGRYVFPSTKGGHVENLNIRKKVHDRRARVDAYTIHDLRRAFAALHAQCGTPIHLVEKMLAHTSGTFGGIVGVYQRYSYDREMRDAVQSYEKYLSSLIAPAA